jgi:short-subunit dehydrogenase
MPNSWHNKIALITGASSGIGAATALELAHHGLRVMLVARRQERLESLAGTIASAGSQAYIIPADLSDPGQRESVCAQVEEICPAPDVLVNSAGLGWYGYYSQMPWEIAQTMLQVNITAMAHLVHYFLPAMHHRRCGHIINIGSISGSLPNQGIAIYSASKASVDAFTTALYRELVGTPLCASVVRAGPVASEFYQAARALPGGRPVPAERFAVSPERVALAVWAVLQRPRRVVYVPAILCLSPWLETLFGRVIDRLGPLLLRKGQI